MALSVNRRKAGPMIRRAILILGLTFGLCLPAASNAQTTCAGHDLIAAMAPADRAALDAIVAMAPFPSGNHWRATKAHSTIDIIGTYHLFDPRMPDHLANLAPVLNEADLIFAEATDTEIAELQAAINTRPELMFTQGATLPERLTKAEWAQVSAGMTARGIPAFLASKFQPWYVSVILSMPPCAMAAMADGSSGLDRLILDAAKAQGIATRPLEPFDTIFRIFDGISPEDQIDMIRAALPLTENAEDLLATMTESYFRGDHRQIWEYSRLRGIEAAGEGRKKAEADFALMEKMLINIRNSAWIKVILDAAPDKALVVAVGAGHLGGENGLLRLLEQAGYTLAPGDF